jgi:3-oxoacyl-[acyl-carrier protein] reductase
MDLELRGKAAIVGGASEGLGYAIAQLLAEEGATVVMVARREAPLAAAAARIASATGARTVPLPADIRIAADCARIVQSAVSACGRLDVLVNNDGAPPLGDLPSFDDAAWTAAVEQNLMSVVRLSRAAMPHLRASGAGRIVNIAALSALQPLPKFGLSVATWAGVIGYAKTLSLEVARDKVTVNTICPGRFATGRLAKVFGGGADAKGGLDDDALAKLVAQVPMGRLGDPRELAGLVAFLCSPLAAYMTGCVLHADGGRRASVS